MIIFLALLVCWFLVALMASSEDALASTNRVRLRQWLQMHATSPNASPANSVTSRPDSNRSDSNRAEPNDDETEIADRGQRFLATITIAANVPLMIAAVLSVEWTSRTFEYSNENSMWRAWCFSALLGILTLVVFQMMPRLLTNGGEESGRWFPVVRFMVALCSPFVAVLMFCGTVILRPLGLLRAPVVARSRGENETEDDGTDEILDLVESAHDAGTLEEGGRELIESIFTFGDTRVHEVMVPRPDIWALPLSSDANRVLNALQESGFSRVPIYEEDIDHVVGVLHIKDVLRALSNGEKLDVAALVRAPLYVPESQAIDVALGKMREQRTHLALVMDEYGGVAGLLTVEDILEELVGDIADEHDKNDAPLQILDEHSAIVDALFHVEDLRDQWDLTLPSGEFDTVGGFMIEQLGRAPVVGDSVETSDATLTVQSARGRRVRKIFIARKVPSVRDDEN